MGIFFKKPSINCNDYCLIVVNAIKNVFSIFNVIFFFFLYLVVLFQKFQVV